jgi:hypothetical protein
VANLSNNSKKLNYLKKNHVKNLEFKKALNQKEPESILRNHIYNIKIPSEKYEVNLDLVGLHKIIENKKLKWESSDDGNNFSQSILFFKQVLTAIENIIVDTRYTDNNHHQNIVNSLAEVNKQVFLPDSPKSIFLQHIFSHNGGDEFRGVFAVMTNTLDYNLLGNKNYFTGVFLAIQFETADFDVATRREAEEKSFSQLRAEFEQENYRILTGFETLVTETENKCTTEVENLKDVSNVWNSQFETQLDIYNSKVKAEIDKSHTSGGNLLKKSLDKKIQLEQAYREHMKFKVPAEYWKERASFLNLEGKKFMNWLIFLTSMGIVMLFSLLWLTPEDMLENIFSKNPARAIRWSIIFITLISLLFVGIQALKKAMFSSFHLARDAEEREKLTVFYLSLIKDSTITQEDRSLVLQALFSRADTGMLKDESGPTMPGIIDKLK